LDIIWSSGWLHSALLLIMITLILTGRRSGVHEQRRRSRVERDGLRAALLAELTALQGVYRLNAELITAGAPSLMSGRAYFSIYRGNMQRLVTLTPAEIAAVVSAFAASELLDAAIMAGNRMRARHPDGGMWQARRFDVKRLHRAARAAAEDAVVSIREAASAPPTGVLTWLRGLGARLAPAWRRPPQAWARRPGVPPDGIVAASP